VKMPWGSSPKARNQLKNWFSGFLQPWRVRVSVPF
jgi:hypothetical protein